MNKGKLTRAQRREFRAMERRLRELDRADARAKASGIDPYDLWLDRRATETRHTPSGSAPPPAHRLRKAIIVTVAVALPVGTIAAVASLRPDRVAARADRPSPGVEVAGTPLGTPAPPPSGPDSYRFVQTQSGNPGAANSVDPVTWDPCRPIHYATSGLAPHEGQELLASAFSEIHQITGFTLINDGPTTEQPSVESTSSGASTITRQPFQAALYGDRWAPILVAWTTPEQIPGLAGQVIGRGGGITVADRAGALTYVSGVLYLDRPQIETQLSDAALEGTSVSRRSQIRSIMLHEIGHVLGLDHVDDPRQLMYPISSPAVTGFGTGDLRGLYRLATGPCAPSL